MFKYVALSLLVLERSKNLRSFLLPAIVSIPILSVSVLIYVISTFIAM